MDISNKPILLISIKNVLVEKAQTINMMSICFHLFYNSEKIDTLFSQLTKELMDSGKSMEEIFQLVQELKTATEKYFHLKKLFWKVRL